MTTEETLSRFPDSLLGDPTKRQSLYSPKLDAYYLDRHRACFESILQFYQTGIEYPPACLDIYNSEKDFYGLKRSHLDIVEEFKDSSCLCCSHEWRVETHRFLVEQPNTFWSYVYHGTDIATISLATVLFVLESEESLKDNFEFPKLGDSIGPEFWLFLVNTLIMAWFTVDIALRMVTWPKFVKYWKDYKNVLDIMSVLPFYIEVIQWVTTSSTAGKANYEFLRALKLIRVVRVFKVVRHSKVMMGILEAVVRARHELLTLFTSMLLFVVTFGSIMFYLENGATQDDISGPNSQFSSILMSCWWVLVSMTTVGYGDMYPVTIAGKFAASLVLCLGLIWLALPMTIIISKFGTEFAREKS